MNEGYIARDEMLSSGALPRVLWANSVSALRVALCRRKCAAVRPVKLKMRHESDNDVCHLFVFLKPHAL